MPLIIECAILGSPQQRLTLAELRSTLKRRFRYYEKEEEKGVKSWEACTLCDYNLAYTLIYFSPFLTKENSLAKFVKKGKI